MNVLIIGSGGREHAIAWKVAQSPKLTKLFIAPGNAGTAAVGTNVPIKVTDFQAIGEFVKSNNIDLVVVGPEEPLVKGIADFLAANADTKNVGVVGASAEGAQLEGSKEFAKQFMQKHGIPTAAYRSFTKDTVADGKRFLETLIFGSNVDCLSCGRLIFIVPKLDFISFCL